MSFLFRFWTRTVMYWYICASLCNSSPQSPFSPHFNDNGDTFCGSLILCLSKKRCGGGMWMRLNLRFMQVLGRGWYIMWECSENIYRKSVLLASLECQDICGSYCLLSTSASKFCLFFLKGFFNPFFTGRHELPQAMWNDNHMVTHPPIYTSELDINTHNTTALKVFQYLIICMLFRSLAPQVSLDTASWTRTVDHPRVSQGLQKMNAMFTRVSWRAVTFPYKACGP